MGVKAAVRRDAMGRFKHEAAAADPVRKVVYMTEDVSDGCFYRFRPTTWGDLSSGTLEVLVAGSGTSGPVTWARVPDPTGATATRDQVSGAKRFNGGEGCYYADDTCWFTTKGDNRVWQYNAAAQTIELAYDDSLVTSGTAPLTGVDNVTGSASGDLFVAEDGGNMEICVITPDDVIAPFLRIDGQSGSEITGPAFSPTAAACTSPASAARAAVPRAASRTRSGAPSAPDAPGATAAPRTPGVPPKVPFRCGRRQSRRISSGSIRRPTSGNAPSAATATAPTAHPSNNGTPSPSQKTDPPPVTRYPDSATFPATTASTSPTPSGTTTCTTCTARSVRVRAPAARAR